MTKCNNNNLEFDKQIKFTGKSYTDPKAAPVETKADLDKITMVNDAFEGMERVVLCDEDYGGAMTRYIFDGDKWVIKSPIISGDDVEK